MKVEMDIGIIYVVEPVGHRHPILKIGKTGLVLKYRLKPGTTYAAQGLRVLRAVEFFNKSLAERRIHAKLAAYHCEKAICGDATEMFIATLDLIDKVLAEELAYQQAYSKPFLDGIEWLKAGQFWRENPPKLLGELMDAKIHRNVSLKHAIIRVINSSSFEGPLAVALERAGISFDVRITKAVVNNPTALLRKLKIRDEARGFMNALSSLSHFNGQGNPIFS